MAFDNYAKVVCFILAVAELKDRVRFTRSLKNQGCALNL